MKFIYKINKKKVNQLIINKIIFLILIISLTIVQGRNTITENNESRSYENNKHTEWNKNNREKFLTIKKQDKILNEDIDNSKEPNDIFQSWKINNKGPKTIDILNYINKEKKNIIQSKIIDDDYTEHDDLQLFEDITTINNNENNNLEKLLNDLHNDLGKFYNNIKNNRRGRRRQLSSEEQSYLLMETLKKKNNNYTDIEGVRGHHETNLQTGIMDMLGRSMSYF